MISNTIEILFIVYINTFLQKKCVLPHITNFTLIYGPFSSLIFMEYFVVFSNAHSILELMLCNRNLTKFDILTLLSSDCKAWALKLSKPLKNQQKMFYLHFAHSNFKVFFCTFSLSSKKIISYLKYLLNLYDEYHFKKYHWLS